MNILWSLVFGAIVVETIVNIIRNLKENNTTWKYWAALGVSLGLGLLVSINYDIDVFKLVGLEGKVPLIGAILTGLIISRGSNIVSDTVDRLNSWRPNKE
jgi:hypothetical protein